MEDKKLNSQKSIDLISRMIQNTQNNLQKNAGSYSIFWGYVTLVVSLADYFLLTATGDYRVHFVWFAIPVIGFPLSFILRRRLGPVSVRTFVDVVTYKLWIPLAVALCTFPFVTGSRALTVVLMLISLGIAQTGLIVKYPVFTVAGFIGLAAALALLFIGGPGQILVFAFFSVVVLIIPGHILNHKAAREHVQRA